MNIEAILVKIIKHELDLPDNYGKTANGDVIPSVIRFSQNIKLFNTDKLQITVRTVSSRVYANRSMHKDNPNAVKLDGSDAVIEVQDINSVKMMQIDAYSRNNEARDRYEEITMALSSIYAQQQMDLYNFRLDKITNTMNISGIDGGSDINRFTITFNALCHSQKIKTIDYYAYFDTEIYNNRGLIGSFSLQST